MMNYLEEYNETDPISIETYAKRLIGKTFADVCKQDDITKAMVVRETTNYEVKHENKKRKGGLGELIEERFFHYQTNNDARPDFDKAGVELKVTPYKQNKNGTLVAKERLILTMIDYFSVVDETEQRLPKEDRQTWQYLKGAKKLLRTSSTGHEYVFSEGAISMIDQEDKPARTMLTSEGGFSRTTHIVKDKMTGRERLLTATEAERIQGFPTNHTKYCLVKGETVEMPLRKRRFMMENALVVNLGADMEKTLDKIFNQE